MRQFKLINYEQFKKSFGQQYLKINKDLKYNIQKVIYFKYFLYLCLAMYFVIQLQGTPAFHSIIIFSPSSSFATRKTLAYFPNLTCSQNSTQIFFFFPPIFRLPQMASYNFLLPKNAHLTSTPFQSSSPSSNRLKILELFSLSISLIQFSSTYLISFNVIITIQSMPASILIPNSTIDYFSWISVVSDFDFNCSKNLFFIYFLRNIPKKGTKMKNMIAERKKKQRFSCAELLGLVTLEEDVYKWD